MDDEPKETWRKLQKAVTASDSGNKSSEVENLFLLLENFGQKDQMTYFRNAQKLNSLKFSELKETLAKEIADYFAEFREKKKELLAKPIYLAEVLAEGATKATVVASKTMLDVKEKVGLL